MYRYVVRYRTQSHCKSKTSVADPLKFWRGLGSADPYLWLMDPDPNPPAIFVSDLQNINKKLFVLSFLLIKYFLKVHLHRIRIRNTVQNKIKTRHIHMRSSLLYSFQLAETRHTFWCFWFVRAWESCCWCCPPGTSGRGGGGPRAAASWGRTGTAGSPAALHKYQSQNIFLKVPNTE